MKTKRKIKVIDLFAGCGGLTLGFENAGFDVVAGADNWKPALEVYQKNFGHDSLDLDLGQVDTSVAILEKYNADMIIGGAPCQDFSQAGKRNEHGGRGSLTVSFAKIIDAIRPKYFIMENVDQLTKQQNFKDAYEILKKAGYGITVKLLDASFCGVPQSRKRYFVIGEMDGEDNALESYLTKNLSKSPMTVRRYFGNKLKTEFYYRHPWSYARRAVYSIDEPSATIRGVNRPIPKGYPGHHLDATSDMCLVRSLTSVERSYIQTFPENFIWHGTKGHTEQLIGNAVPVKLAEYVAKALLEYIAQKTPLKSLSPQTQAKIDLFSAPYANENESLKTAS